MAEWTCDKCGMRFTTHTLGGADRMRKHQTDGCDARQEPAAPIVNPQSGIKKAGVVGKQYPYRKPKPGGH